MKKIQILLTAFAVILLAVTGCSNIFFDKPDLELNDAIPKGFGAVKISFTHGTARTAMPDPVLSAFHHFEYFFAKDGGVPISVPPQNDLFILEPGSYQLMVKAYVSMDETRLAAQGTSNANFIIKAGEHNPDVTVTLHPIVTGEGTGSIEFNLNYPSGVTVDSFSLIRIAGDESYNLMDANISTTGTNPITLNGSLDNIPVGYYVLDVLLRNASGFLAGTSEVVHIYQNLVTQTKLEKFTFVATDFGAIIVTNTNDSGQGSLRQAISIAQAGQNIKIMLEHGSVIELNSSLSINKSLAIYGNGVVITRSPSWRNSSQLLSIANNSGNVKISRIHFRDGRATNGAAINAGSNINLTLESCVFSGNHVTADNSLGGAIHTLGTTTIIGCTFYGNSSAYNGGAVSATGVLNLTGNLFYGNTAVNSGPVVFSSNANNVISGGYNAVDVSFQACGFADKPGDISVTDVLISPKSFRHLANSIALEAIKEIPEGYPSEDFYGELIVSNAAIGAVQSVVNGSGNFLDIQVNNLERGSVNISPALNEDALVSGSVTLTAVPNAGFIFVYWLVNNINAGNKIELTQNITEHTKIQAVFKIDTSVTIFTDASNHTSIPGTFRYAIANAEDGDVIRFVGITPGVTTIALVQPINIANLNITIEGNGVTLTHVPYTGGDPQLLRIIHGIVEDSKYTISISRVHFKAGYKNINQYSSGIYNVRGTLNLESCIFSGHATNNTNGASSIYNSGILNIKGCSFIDNISVNGSVIYSGSVNITGSLFNKNSTPLIRRTSGTVNLLGYNVVDIDILTGTNSNGWNIAHGDAVIKNGLLVSPKTGRLLPGGGVEGIIEILPEEYPTVDFYGDPIKNGAAAGAVQSFTDVDGYFLDVTVNDEKRGNVKVLSESVDSIYTGSVTLTANTNTGYEFAHWLKDGENAGNTNPLVFTMEDNTKVQAVFIGMVVDNFSDVLGSVNTPGTIRFALNNHSDGEIIRFVGVTPGLSVIELNERLDINNNVTIEGNGITLARSPSWITKIDTLVNVSLNRTAIIRRAHFKDGRITTRDYYHNNGPAIHNKGTLTLESCIFSENLNTQGDTDGSGAIYNSGNLTVKACTFANNTAWAAGGAIRITGGSLSLTGNLFYNNSFIEYVNYSYYGVVSRSGGTVTSGGFNVVDVTLGTANGQSGWASVSGDKTVTTLPLSPKTFRLRTGISGGGALNVITALPADYPTVDFYGAPISNGAAAGAVQATATGNYIDLTYNYPDRGTVNISPASEDFLFTGSVTMTAVPEPGYELLRWIQDENDVGNGNPRTIIVNSNITLQAVFGIVVNNFSDTINSENTPGTLRYALTNYQSGEVINFRGVTAGTSVIELAGSLPQITRNVTIEGNGITLTRSPKWTTVDDSSQLLVMGDCTATIRRMHFKDGRATNYGAAISKRINGNLTLESCIFSGNITDKYGGAIYNTRTLTVRGCTFYGNHADAGGAISSSTTNEVLTLTGNLFYGNTSSYYSDRSTDSIYYYRYSLPSSYNVFHRALGKASQIIGSGDKQTAEQMVTIGAFMLYPNSEALNTIATLPADYPRTDFYGNAVNNGAAAGAVQTIKSNGFFLNLEDNDIARGSVSVSPLPDKDSYYSGTTNVTLTASPVQGRTFSYWLVNNGYAGNENPLTLNVTGHTKVQAVYDGWLVSNFNDSEGSASDVTLRYALNNAKDGDVIGFIGVTPGSTTIGLIDTLPVINKKITIAGNGINITRHSSWTTINDNSRFLNLSGSATVVNISRIHFKDGRVNWQGAAIQNNGAILILESCIFNNNQSSGAITNSGSLAVRACTFYNNKSYSNGGAIKNEERGFLSMTGNLFHTNTATDGGAAVYNHYRGEMYSYYNVIDVTYGNTEALGYWVAGTGDTRFASLSISGVPFNTTTFAPVTNTSLRIIVSGLPGFPATDFYGNTRTFPAAPGAVRQ